jgi:hypothetical protein
MKREKLNEMTYQKIYEVNQSASAEGHMWVSPLTAVSTELCMPKGAFTLRTYHTCVRRRTCDTCVHLSREKVPQFSRCPAHFLQERAQSSVSFNSVSPPLSSLRAAPSFQDLAPPTVLCCVTFF